jgi:C-terminal processing protease CtpA/Prc
MKNTALSLGLGLALWSLLPSVAYGFSQPCLNSHPLSSSTVLGVTAEEHNDRNQNKNWKKLRVNNPNSGKHRMRRIYLHRPIRVIENNYEDAYSYRHQTQLKISTGLTFDDGDQLLVSAQKPLGMVLEEREEKGCVVTEVIDDGAAYKAGVKVGDLLVAVQNVDVGCGTFEEVYGRIGDAPRVVNLRFWRNERGNIRKE